ncbi:MAG: PEP-CTERM sorting domain-containing protein [Desulfobacteria bacterium]
MLKKWMIGFLGLIMIPTFASAALYSFTNITNNGNTDVGGQLSVDVTGQVFTFYNNVGIASSITDVYFDDGGTLLGTFALTDSGTGVAFSSPATPGDLPGGNTIGFVTEGDLSANSDSPVSANGVNSSSEWLRITFNTLLNGNNADDILAALGDGSLRIGLHVQSIALQGGSDSYVNNGTPVPEPGTMMLLGSGLVGLTGWGRKKFRK